MSAIDMTIESQAGLHQPQTKASDRDPQQLNGAADATRSRSRVAFGARAAILAGALATGCAVATPAVAHATTAHAAAHAMTAVALGATTTGVVSPLDSSCCS